jgi:exodeoxyribonuclease VII small subunit
MAKTAKAAETNKHEQVTNISLEEKLERLEILGENIRRPDIPLDKALKDFEEGIKLARSLEKELEKIQNRIEILMNGTNAKATESPELELFDNEE